MFVAGCSGWVFAQGFAVLLAVHLDWVTWTAIIAAPPVLAIWGYVAGPWTTRSSAGRGSSTRTSELGPPPSHRDGMTLDLQPIRDRTVDQPYEVDLRDAYLVGRPEEADRCRIVALTRTGNDLLENAVDDIKALCDEVEQWKARAIANWDGSETVQMLREARQHAEEMEARAHPAEQSLHRIEHGLARALWDADQPDTTGRVPGGHVQAGTHRRGEATTFKGRLGPGNGRMHHDRTGQPGLVGA